jgi:TonB dependent receptor.
MIIRETMLKKILLAIVVFGFSYSIALSQEQRELDKEVKVRTTYQPKINKALRLGKLPVIKDTSTFTPSFDYFIQAKPLNVGFSPAEIPAAKIVGEPLKKLNSHTLTLAGGNYSTLFGDYRFNNQRSKTADIGVHLRHCSSNGKLKLEDGDKVKPDYTEQLAEVYGTAYLDEGKVSGKLFYKHSGFNYFGFPQLGDIEGTTTNLFPYDKQKLNNFGLNALYQSNFKDEEQLNFGLGLQHEHFSDDIDAKENDILISGNARIRRGDAFWSLRSEFDYFAIDGLNHWEDSNWVSERKTLKWSLNPQYLLQTGNFNLQLGVNAVLATGDDSGTKLYPDVKIDFEAIDGIMSLFAGLNGDLKMNRYKDIVEENRFIYSGLNVLPSNVKYKLFGGIRGSMSSNSSFTLKAEYSAIENQYFFIQNNILIPQGMTISGVPYSNKFGVVYDDVNVLRLGAELTIGWTEKLELNSSVWYNNYSMDELGEAWHMPEFEMQVNAVYSFTDDLTFNAGVNMIGERSTLLVRYDLTKVEKLEAVYDLNIGANYSVNEHFSVFAQVNNLFADKYYQWDGYPSQGLNFLLGIKVNL